MTDIQSSIVLLSFPYKRPVFAKQHVPLDQDNLLDYSDSLGSVSVAGL